VGATLYSRARANAGVPPRCAGLSKRLAADLEVEPAALPPDVAPHGDFSVSFVSGRIWGGRFRFGTRVVLFLFHSPAKRAHLLSFSHHH
jgi:hypothetical protein